jgi:hypothetical protein
MKNNRVSTKSIVRNSAIFLGCIILVSLFMHNTILRKTETGLDELKLLNEIKVEKILFCRVGFEDVVYTEDEVIDNIIKSFKIDKWKPTSWNLKLAPSRDIIINNYVIGLYDTEKNYVSISFLDKGGRYKYLIPDNVYEEIVGYFIKK